MEAIRIEGNVTVADTARYIYFHQQRRAWWYFWPLVAMNILLCVMLVIAFAVVPSDVDFRNSTMFAFGALGFWCWCFGWSPYSYSKKVLGKNAPTGEATTLTFGENGIDWKGSEASSHIEWTKVERLDETKTLFLLYIGPLAAIRIPKRFFSDARQLHAWQAMCAQYLPVERIRQPWIGRFF